MRSGAETNLDNTACSFEGVVLDGYDRDRHNIENQDRGAVFERGTTLFFRDRESGYNPDDRKFSGGGHKIKFDKVKYDSGRTLTIEEKSGRIGGRKDERQLEVVRILLEQGKVDRHTLRSVEGERVSEEIRQMIEALEQDFPTRFEHHIISREDAREIWALGRQLEKGRQLEFDGVREMARQHWVRQQEQARGSAREDGRDTRSRIREPSRDTRTAPSLPPNPEIVRSPNDPRSTNLPVRAALSDTIDPRVGAVETEGRGQDWAHELSAYNQRLAELENERIRDITARIRSPVERASAVEHTRRSVAKLRIDPARAADQQVDLDKFRAVREGVYLGYDAGSRTHTFQRAGADPVRVAHDDRERRMGQDARRVDAGMDLTVIEVARLVDIGHAHAVEEAVRARLPDAPLAPEADEQSVERGLHRDR